MHNPIDRITASTKYACGKFDPANRDFRPGRRGEFSCRSTIRYPIPSTVVSAISSTNNPYQAWSPINGNSNPGSNVCPTACTRVNTRAPKPTITNQCAAPCHAPLQHPGVTQELLDQRPQPRHPPGPRGTDRQHPTAHGANICTPARPSIPNPTTMNATAMTPNTHDHHVIGRLNSFWQQCEGRGPRVARYGNVTRG